MECEKQPSGDRDFGCMCGRVQWQLKAMYCTYTVHSRVRKLQNAKVSVSNLRESSGLDFTPLFGQINFGTYSGRSMGRRVRGRGGWG